MNKTFFVAGLTVLLGVSLFVTGCPTEAETVTVTVPDVIHVDEVVAAEEGLITALANPANKVVELVPSAAVNLATVKEIPAGKTLVIRNSGTNTFAVKPKATDGLEIKGTVYVELGGILVASATNPVKVTGSGVLNVGKGTLSVDATASVNDGTAATALGTSKAVINGGMLESDAELDYTKFSEWGTYVTKGELILTAALKTTTPQGIIDAVSGKVNADKRLNVKADTAEATATTLSIPAGLLLTALAGDTLGSVTAITVAEGGSFMAAGGVGASGGVAITVNAGGSATVGTVAKLKQSSVAGTFTATAVTAFDSIADIDVVAGGTVNGVTFPVNADVKGIAIASGVTIGSLSVTSGTLIVATGKKLTLEAGAALNITGTVALEGTGSVLLTAATTTDGAKITGTGKLKAGKTEIVGGTSGWQAVGASASVIIASATGDNASITGNTGVLTAQGAGATITQLAGENNELLIAPETTIALGGTAAAVGSLTLTGAASNPGTIKFADPATSIVSTDNSAGGDAFTSAAKIGGKTLGTNTAAVYTTVTGAAGTFVKLLGSAANNVLVGGDADNTVVIDGSKDVTT